MTVLTFPSNPIEGQRYAAPNGVQYVFDGVKWIVETTTTSSEAITNSTQDRVAPMFVEGNNQGISFTYDATTNTMSAEVTAVNGNQLVNGDYTVELNTNGALNLPESSETGVAIVQSTESIKVVAYNKTWSFANDGNLTIPPGGDIKNSTGSSVLHNGVSITDFGEGFSLTAANKIVTRKLYSTNETQPNQHYRLELDTNGVVHLPDQSIINGATLKSVPGNYAGITAGPVGHDEDSWVWVDDSGTWIATDYSDNAYQWHFDNTGKLTLPTNGTISFGTDNGDNWHQPLVNTVQAALEELAARLTAVENFEIEGGNAYTLASAETIIDGNGA